MEVYFGDINAQGGIYGRKLQLEVKEADNRSALLEKGKELIEGGEVFALVGAFTAGVDNEYVKLAEQNEVPMVGPFTQFNQEDNSLQRFTFYLLGGISVQARALVDYASRKLGDKKPRTVVVYPPGPLWAAVAKAIEAQGGRHEWPVPTRIQYVRGRMDAGKLARRLKEARIDAVFFFGGTKELLALAGEAERLAWAPYLFLSGSLAGKEIFEIPSLFQDKIFLAYAMDPADHTRAGVREFSAMQRQHGLTKKHLLAQIASYSATKVLVEGLKRAGRGLSREKLIAVLEKMYQYETGLTPKLTFSQNRRIGALGAHIVSVDLEKQKFAAGSEWIKVDLQ
jgi:ABC-type branched-subunit amino acid transport system substrate-binding protein